MEVSGRFYAPATLPGGKGPSYAIHRRLSGSQNRSGDEGEEKKSPFSAPAGNQTPAVQPVA
jgi:hypothetical protein